MANAWGARQFAPNRESCRALGQIARLPRPPPAVRKTQPGRSASRRVTIGLGSTNPKLLLDIYLDWFFNQLGRLAASEHHQAEPAGFDIRGHRELDARGGLLYDYDLVIVLAVR